MDTNTQEDVKMEAKIYKTKQTKGHRPTSRIQAKARNTSPPEPSGAEGPVNTHISDFCPLDWGENK